MREGWPVLLLPALAAMVLIVLGLLLVVRCGGSVSLVLFAAAVEAAGIGAARREGVALLLLVTIIAIALVLAGLAVAGAAGCHV